VAIRWLLALVGATIKALEREGPTMTEATSSKDNLMLLRKDVRICSYFSSMKSNDRVFGTDNERTKQPIGIVDYMY